LDLAESASKAQAVSKAALRENRRGWVPVCLEFALTCPEAIVALRERVDVADFTLDPIAHWIVRVRAWLRR
jgi:hypothetical protein